MQSFTRIARATGILGRVVFALGIYPFFGLSIIVIYPMCANSAQFGARPKALYTSSSSKQTGPVSSFLNAQKYPCDRYAQLE